MEKKTDPVLTGAARALHALAEFVSRRPHLVLSLSLAVFAVCITGTLKWLRIDSDRNSLVGSHQRYHQIFLEFKKEFPAEDDMVVVVESSNPEKNRQFVERLGARVQAETDLFTDVFYKADLQALGRKSLQFLSQKDLGDLEKSISEYEPFIRPFAQSTNLLSLFLQVNTLFRTSGREPSPQTDSMLKTLPALRRIVERGTDALMMPEPSPSPGVSGLLGGSVEDERQVYATFRDGRVWLLTARARSSAQKEKAVEKLRQLVGEIQIQVTGVNAGLTGEPVLEYDEMRQSASDSTLATAVALVVCALIFITAYRETGRPLKATVALILGLGYTLGFTTLAIGSLNLLTITFAPILIDRKSVV